MTMHTRRGVRFSLKVDDGFGNLIRPDYNRIITRIVSGWPEL